MHESCTKSIETYKDYSYVMYVMCYNSSSFYCTIKNVINIPIIICTTAMSILSSSDFESINNTEKQDIIRIFSIGFNLLIALLIAILNVYKIAEKEFFFNSQASGFMKISNNIEVDLAKNKTTLTKIDILKIIYDYNSLCENMSFHIPQYIRRSAFKKYHNLNLPLLLLENKREASILTTYYKKFTLLDSKKSMKEPKSPSSTSDVSSYTSGRIRKGVFDSSSSSTSNEDVVEPRQIYLQGLSPIHSVYCEDTDASDSDQESHKCKASCAKSKELSSILSPHPPLERRPYNRLYIKLNHRHSLNEIYDPRTPNIFSRSHSGAANKSPIASLNRRHLKAFERSSRDINKSHT